MPSTRAGALASIPSSLTSICSQLADEDKSGYLLRSVLNDARTKIVFGDLDFEDLQMLSRNVMLDRYSPWALKDELTSPVFVPVETTRISRSVSHSHSSGWGLSLPESVTEGTSASTSQGTSESLTLGVQHSRSEALTRGTSQGRAFATGTSMTDVDSWSESDAEGEQWAEGDSNATSWAESSAMSLGESAAMGEGAVLSPDGEHISMSTNATAGSSAAFVSGMSAGGSHVQSASHGGSRMHGRARGGAHGVTHSMSESTSETTSESHTTGTTTGESLALQRGTSEVETTGTSRAVTHGCTPSWSEEESESVSETESPFHEYHREDMVSSRTYLTPEEQTLLAIQEMKALPMAHFVLKTPESSACVMRAPWVDEPWISKRALEEKLARVYDQPYYVRLDAPHDKHEHALPAPARAIAAEHTPPAKEMKNVTPEPLRIPELLPPAHDDPDDDAEPTNEDLLLEP